MTKGPQPVAPSVVLFEQVVFTKDGWVPVSPARSSSTSETRHC